MMPHELTPMNYPTLTSFVPDFLVSHFPSADGDLVLPTPEELSFMKSQGWLKPNGLAFYSLKTCRGFSITPAGKLSELSSMKFMNSGIVSNGACLTRRISEYRNSEGAFITLKDGRILFVYSRYSAAGGDDGAAADLYGILSADNGESFSAPFPVLTKEQMQADNIMSVSFMRMANGDIGLFFLAKRDADQCICYLMRSSAKCRNG